MFEDNTDKIENNLITNLVRVFSAYGWYNTEEPDNYLKKLNVVTYSLHHGMARDYLQYLDSVIAARRKDHKWGLYTSTFVEGVRSLLNAFCQQRTEKGYKLINLPCTSRNYKSLEEISKDNIFRNIDHAIEAINRLESFGKTNIRYSLIEEYGEERVLKDLRKVCPYATLSIHYDEHQPDQLRDWLYYDGRVKMTVMYPIMPLVYIALNN